MLEVFMKIPVGIVGYGNLGKAVEKCLKKSKKFELVAIFSRRNVEGTTSIAKLQKYVGKIELLFLCGGSQNEIEQQALTLIKYFNIVESYDNHSRLKTFHKQLNTIALKNKKIALCSLGWDPGIFSFVRGFFDCLGYPACTFWGKGTSQGHTQALKNISGVKDALQFTIPNKKIIDKIKSGEKVEPSKNFHKRDCFIVCENADKASIKKSILSMEDYFEGYETTVHFVSQEKLDSLKTFSHKGEVFVESNIMNFSLNLPSNPDFTARVMTSLAHHYESLKQKEDYGVHTIFDLDLKNILPEDKYIYL